jgi:predicted NBD/HSP70 family sugar kinase
MIIAIDTGGTKTLITSFGDDGIPKEQIKFPTPQEPQEYINLLRNTLSDNYNNQSVDAIVIAVPGTLDSNGAIIWAPNLVKWEKLNVAEALRGAIGNAPILIENDAKLAGLYETRIMDVIPKQSLYVTISTGIGTGIITEGHIDPDMRNSEGGRALIEYDGIMQEWQDFASGKAFYNKFGQYVRDIADEQIWQQIAERISLGFLELIPTLQPDVVVIGGSVGTYFDKYGKFLVQILKDKLPIHIPCPPFIQAKNSEQAVIYGCYYYALDNNIIITT